MLHFLYILNFKSKMGRGRGRDRGRVRVRVTDEGHHVEQRVVEEVLVVGLVLHVAQRGLRSEDRVGVVPG